ncbi:MAG: 50S ribosomal protein L13 [Chloroflexi bacterium]|nr:50S ribosomal protein L13 [Chloroflexota bacterium]
MKTYATRPADIKRGHHVIDATGQTLGRMTIQIARLLMGKHKPIFSPNQDTGDFVTVINAEKVRFSGKKATQKLYYRHSGYPGGLKSVSLERMMETAPTRVIEHAVKGMLPHTSLGARMFKKLRVFAGGIPARVPRAKAAVEAEKGQE